MRAVTVVPGQKDSLQVRDVPDPEPASGEAVVRVLQAGLCGTDAEISAGMFGEAPAGCPYLVLGHENLGAVEAAGGSELAAGDLVVATVRRPCPEACLPCRSGHNDMCLTGHYRERGVQGLHGYMSARYTEDPRYLIRVPPHLRPIGVLVEPMAVVRKGLDQALRIQQRLDWQPERAVVLGAGPIGILAAASMRLRGLEVTVASREPEESARRDLLRDAGIAYVSTSVTPIDRLPERLGAIDIVFEATGAAAVIASAMSIMGLNGVCILAGVTEAGHTAPVDLGAWNRQMVLGNRLVFGTVNAVRGHFEAAVRDLEAAEERLPGWTRRLITRRLPYAHAARALARDPAQIKTVLDFE